MMEHVIFLFCAFKGSAIRARNRTSFNWCCGWNKYLF